MKTFEHNLAMVLGHSMVWESTRLEVDNGIPQGFYRNGGSPAPTTQEAMAEVMKAYRENIIPMIQQQVAAARQYEPEMQALREQVSPREQQLNLNLYRQFGPQFAQASSEIARQNAEQQALTDLGIVRGTGRELVREAMRTQKEADPEAYRARELALANLERLQGSLLDPNAGLGGGERAEIERSLARENFARGTGATPTATSTVANAMAFGQAGEARRAQRQSAIANAAQLAAGAVQPLSSRIDTFQLTSTGGGCLEASVRHVFFPAQAADLKDSPSARAIAERQDAWKADLPQDDQALWDWLSALDDASRLSLLAHCVSFGVNALYEKPNPYGGNGVSQHGLERRLTQADRLARATGLDMVEAGWRPSVDNYLGRVPKRRIVEAVREGAGDRAAQLIEHLKKAEMGKEAERLLADARWLPEPLRLADTDTSSETAEPEAEASSVDLPAFLSADEEASDEDTEPLPAIAAE